MKKVIAGGFLGLFGIIGIVAVCLFASNHLLSNWYGNRLLYTILQGDFSLPFGLSIVLLIAGIVLMLIGCFTKDN